MDYQEVLKHLFIHSHNKDNYLYAKLDTPHIVLYAWESGFAYKARYKCLPANQFSLQKQCDYIEAHFATKKKHKEYYLFTDRLSSYPTAHIKIRLLTYQDMDLLEAMKRECPQNELAMAQIKIDDIHVLGAFIKDKLIGACSVLELWSAYDIGVLVHPDYRRQHVATTLVANCAEWILSQAKLCMYRCDDFNIGSYHTALKLGFIKKIDVVIYDLEK